MKVRIYGFEWQLGNGITLDEFYNYVQIFSGQEVSNKVIVLGQVGEFWTGVMLTIKDVKAYCAMKKEGGNFTISAKMLDDNSRMIDFNYFIICPTTGRGLYQHYFQSAMPNTFCNYCNTHYSKLRSDKIISEIGALGGEDVITAKDKKEIMRKYKGGFGYSTLSRPGSFLDSIKSLKEIKEFSYEISGLADEDNTYTPTSKYAKRAYHRFVISDGSPIKAVFEGIEKTLGMGDVGRAKVVGIDAFGNEDTYKLLNDYFTFEEFEYDDIVLKVSINSENITASLNGSDVISELLSIAARKEVHALLTTPTK